ncbi:MAG: hypothetical protein MUD09_05940 [Desulfobacterales bacterium]|jgi:hypothetical protein|nr:hypothetical protein [Desulfobacterales bacterium]
MSIRLIAMELYRVIKEVEKLEKKMENAPFEKREALEIKLRQARAEERQFRAMIETKKEPLHGSPLQKKR